MDWLKIEARIPRLVTCN